MPQEGGRSKLAIAARRARKTAALADIARMHVEGKSLREIADAPRLLPRDHQEVDRRGSAPRSLPVSATDNHKMVRLPTAVYDRLLRLAADIDRQRERSGRAYANVPQTEQGDRGAWTPIHAVISRALDEFEGHRRRGNRKRAAFHVAPDLNCSALPNS